MVLLVIKSRIQSRCFINNRIMSVGHELIFSMAGNTEEQVDLERHF